MEETPIEETPEEQPVSAEDVDSIIKKHIAFSVTAGAIPIPLVDFVAITAIQLDMLKQISDCYGVRFDRNEGKSLASSMIGVSLAKIGASFVKAIPGVGTLAGIGAQVILAGASTYALGKVFELHYANEGTLANFDPKKMKKEYADFLVKGKGIAKKMKEETSQEDVFNTIEKLKQLQESGAITEEDFEATKKKLLEKITNEV